MKVLGSLLSLLEITKMTLYEMKSFFTELLKNNPNQSNFQFNLNREEISNILYLIESKRNNDKRFDLIKKELQEIIKKRIG